MRPPPDTPSTRACCCAQVVAGLRAAGIAAWANLGSVCIVLPPESVTPAIAGKYGVVFGQAVAHICVMDSVPDSVLEGLVADMGAAAAEAARGVGVGAGESPAGK